MSHFPDPLHLIKLLLQLLKDIDYVQRMTSNSVYREVLQYFKYVNKYMLIKYFIVSMCELLERVKLATIATKNKEINLT